MGSAAVVSGGLSVSASSQTLAALLGVPESGFADWQWCDGGGVQDGVHAAIQTIGDALEPRIGPNDIGFACHPFERHLERSIRRGLGFARTADVEQRCLGSRQQGESSRDKGHFRPSCRIIYDAAATTPVVLVILHLVFSRRWPLIKLQRLGGA